MGLVPINRIKTTNKSLDVWLKGLFDSVDTRVYFFNNSTYTIPINGEYTIRAYQGDNGAYGKIFGYFTKGERLTITLNTQIVNVTSSLKPSSEFGMFLNKNATVYAIGANYNGAIVIGGAGRASAGGSATLYGDGTAYGGGGGAYGTGSDSSSHSGYDGGNAYIYGNGSAYGGGGGATTGYYHHGKGGYGFHNGESVSSWKGDSGNYKQGGNSVGCGGAVGSHAYYAPGGTGGSGGISPGGTVYEGGSARAGRRWGYNSPAAGYFAGSSAEQDYMNYTTAQYDGGDGGTGGFFGGRGGLAADRNNHRMGNGGTGTYGVGGYGYYGGNGQIRGGGGEYMGGSGLIAGYGPNGRNGNSIRHKPIIHSTLNTGLGAYGSIVIIEYGHSTDRY